MFPAHARRTFDLTPWPACRRLTGRLAVPVLSLLLALGAGEGTARAANYLWTHDTVPGSPPLGKVVADAGDLNLDGAHDLLVRSDWPLLGGSAGPSAIHVLLGHPSGTFDPTPFVTIQWPTPDPFEWHWNIVDVIAAGDLNGDGRNDIVTLERDYSDSPFWYLLGDDGCSNWIQGRVLVFLTPPNGYVAGILGADMASVTIVGEPGEAEIGFINSIAIGDVTDDGIADLLVGECALCKKNPSAFRV